MITINELYEMRMSAGSSGKKTYFTDKNGEKWIACDVNTGDKRISAMNGQGGSRNYQIEDIVNAWNE